MSISRRRFLKWAGAAGIASAAAANPVSAASGKTFKGYPESYGVLHDVTRCVGCRRCEKACNKINNLPKPKTPFDDSSVFDEIRRTTIDEYTVVNRFQVNNRTVFAKKQCNHCLEPACASACFVKAFKKLPEGPVVYDPSVCVGCRYCMVACPFEIPSYQYDDAFTPEVVKCTMCAGRIKEGKKPGCVETCPKEALIYSKRKDLLRIAREKIQRHPDRYVDHIYGETEMGGTSWLYLSGAPFTNVGMREDLGTASAPSLTSGALHVIPMVVALWPVFLTGMYGMNKRREQIAEQEKNEAVRKAVASTQAEADKELSERLEKAAKEKERALDKAEKDKEKAVAKALEEAGADTEGGDD